MNNVGVNMRDFIFEALRMKCLSHQNVMTLLGICWSPNSEHEQYYRPLILLPYMVLQDLRNYLRKQQSLYVLSSPAEGDEDVAMPRDVNFGAIIYFILLIFAILAFQTSSVWISNCKRNGVFVRKNDTTSRFGCAELHVLINVFNRSTFIHQVNCFRVDWDLTIKISDFGLARALEKDKDYYRNTPDKAGLPIRWVALEGLTEGIFTTKSDVVSQSDRKLDQV